MKLTRLRAVIYAGFVLTGMVTTLLGPVLPALASRWSLDDAHAGYLFTTQFLGSMVGVGLSSLIVPRFGFTHSLALSYVLLALGVGAIGVGPWALGLAAAATYGLGLGISIPATNLWVSKTSEPKRAAALNVVNLAWGIGAVSLPAVVAIAVRANFLRSLFLVIAGASLILAVTLFAVARGEAIPHTPRIDIDARRCGVCGYRWQSFSTCMSARRTRSQDGSPCTPTGCTWPRAHFGRQLRRSSGEPC